MGRLDDISSDGMALIRDIKTIYANYGFSTQILVASVRHPVHVVEAACIGADIATMPFAVLQALVKHPLTDAGLDRFLQDWDKLPPEAKRWKTAMGSNDRPASAAQPARSARSQKVKR